MLSANQGNALNYLPTRENNLPVSVNITRTLYTILTILGNFAELNRADTLYQIQHADVNVRNH